MRFFHLSDLHIGLKLMNRDLSGEQDYIFNQIITFAAAQKPDAVVIAGDIYDRSVPSAEAVELFDKFVTRLSETIPDGVIMIISGNHDSAQRIDCFRSVLARHNLHLIGTPPRTKEEHIEKVSLTDKHGAVNFYLLPFVKPSMVKAIVGEDENGNNLSYQETLQRLIERETINPNERNVIVSHQFYLPKGKKADEIERMDSEIRTVGNIDEICADVLGPFDYAALGHIHKPMKVGKENVRYCGTPLACSVSEAGQQKGIIMVDMAEKGTLTTTVLPLKPLHKVRVIKGSLEAVLKESCEDYVTVVLRDEVDFDALDMKDKLRFAFPNLLEIRGEYQGKTNYQPLVEEKEILEPFALCCSFLKDRVDADEEAAYKKILEDVINTVSEMEGERL